MENQKTEVYHCSVSIIRAQINYVLRSCSSEFSKFW